MSEKILLEDLVGIGDSVGPKGFVIITDKDGKIIVKKHNIILENGRNYIFEKFILNALSSSILSESSYTEKFSNYKIKNLHFFDDGKGLPEYTDMELPEAGLRITKDIENSKISIQPSLYNQGIRLPYLALESELLFDETNIGTLSYVSGLMITISNGSNEIPITKIKFDKIPVYTTAELSLKYYIYF